MHILNTLKRIVGWLMVVVGSIPALFWSVELYHTEAHRTKHIAEVRSELILFLLIIAVGFFLTDIWKKKSLK